MGLFFPPGLVLTPVDRQNAARDQGDLGECQVQGSLLSVPLHPRDHGQREGREAEAVFAAWSSGQGAQVTRAARKRTLSEEPRLFCCVLYYALEHKIKWRDAMRKK